MDEVAENSDELMERYLEGEEISHDEIVEALKDGVTRGHDLPGHLRHRDEELRHRPAARRARQRPSVARPQGRGRRHATRRATRSRSSPRKPAIRSSTSSRRLPTRSRAASTCSASTPASLKGDSQLTNVRAHSKERIGQLLVPQGKEMGHADEFGPGDIGAVAKLKETRSGDVLSGKDASDLVPAGRAPAAVMAFAIEPKSKGDEEKVWTRASPAPGRGPDARRPPRPADRRADHRGAVAGPRRGDRRPDEAQVRRRGEPQAAARPLPGDDQEEREGAGPLQEADGRARAVRRLPHRDRAAAARRRVRVRQQDQGRRHPDELHPGGREGSRATR